MLSSTSLRALWVALFLGLLAGPAWADDLPAGEDEPPPSTGERLDTWFGEWVVSPIGKVLLWDVWFWDNHLRGAEHVGETLGAPDGDEPWQQITGWEGGGKYQVQPLATIDPDTVSPALTEPTRLAFGPVEVELQDRDGVLEAHVIEQDVDLEALGLEPYVEDGPPMVEGAPAEAPTDTITLDTIAPFPVTLDLVAGQTVAGEVEVPTDSLPFQEGMGVHLEPGEDGAPRQGHIVEVGEDDLLTVRLPEATVTQVDNPADIQLPFIVIWLVLGATFFTLRMAFINLRGFGHAVKVTTGKYTDPSDPGEISHFQALTAALSATVGLGNIAGVAIAISIGGPGAVFWMVMAAFLGMTSKFTECTLGQMYRTIRPDGTVSGGPMHYLSEGLSEMGMRPLGKVLAVLFAIMCIGGSFGGGNMFQANQSFAAITSVAPGLEEYGFVYGLLLATLVGVVIIGGIKSIGRAASLIVPAMCGLYVLAGLWILATHAGEVPGAFATIVQEAFFSEAMAGGVIGVIVVGFQRASFSNEAGIGSASIAHSAASTKEPVREGIVALLEPFIDTVLVCTMTGLVVVITGAYLQPAGDGIEMTSQAFGTVIGWFPVLLSVAVVLFAFSTMLAWSYYGERCATWLLGAWASTPYKVLFLGFAVLGAVFQLGNVLGFSDLMILGMAFPNILGAVLLSGKVKRALDDYMGRLRRGELEVQKPAHPPKASAGG